MKNALLCVLLTFLLISVHGQCAYPSNKNVYISKYRTQRALPPVRSKNPGKPYFELNVPDQSLTLNKQSPKLQGAPGLGFTLRFRY